jgi:hypothetical protein
MQRAHGSIDAAAAAAAAATVAPLLQLKRAARKAEVLARFSRAAELYERALAAAELALPRNSLVVAALLSELRTPHTLASDARPSSSAAAERMALSQRSFHLLHAHWQAGTLFAPTAEEVAYFVEDEFPGLPAQMCGAFFYIFVAKDAVQQQLLHAEAEAEARLQGVYGALRAALEMDARGMLERHPRTGQAWQASSESLMMVSLLKLAVHRLVTAALSDEAGLIRMRAICGLTAAEETALRQLAERYKATAKSALQRLQQETEHWNAMQQQAAAADAARYGLRRCALPACDAQEPHPKLFKLCGRCRRVAYCCAAHSVEDWKRHKRETAVRLRLEDALACVNGRKWRQRQRQR